MSFERFEPDKCPVQLNPDFWLEPLNRTLSNPPPVSSQISTSSTSSIENDDGSIQADMKKIIKKSKKNGSRLQNDEDAKTKINDLLDE